MNQFPRVSTHPSSSAPSAVGISCLLALLFSVSVSASAAELAWPADYTGDQPPAGWELAKSPTSKGQLKFDQGRMLLTSELSRFHHVSRALDVDGTDAAPLLLSCRIAIDTNKELGGMPTWLALYWKPDAVVVVGLGGASEGIERWEPQRRSGWAWWVNGADRGHLRVERGIYSAQSPGHFRIVLSGRDLSAYASNDGLRWQSLATFARQGSPFAGPPVRVFIGRGGLGDSPEQRKPLLANESGDQNWTDLYPFIISNLSITNEAPKLPRSQLSGKTKGWDDVREATLAATTVAQWQLLGPLPPGEKIYGPETTIDPKQRFKFADGKEGSWQPYSGEENNRRSVNLKSALKMSADNQVAFAATTITCDAARDETFHFDGAKGVQVFVNGRMVADKWGGWEADIVPDRLGATVALRKGDNQIVLKLISAWDGNSRFSFRHDATPLIQRIANLRQTVSDLPEDVEGFVTAHQDIAHLWESLGRQRQAADALGEALEREGLSGQQVDALAFERARLHRALRDTDAVVADVKDLAKRRQAGNEREAVGGQLKIARLWEQMGFPDQALAAIGEALAAKEIAPDLLTEGYLERARLHRQLKQEPQVTTDLKELAGRLPAGDALTFEVALQALAAELAAGQGDPTALLATVAASPRERAVRTARVHNLLTGAAETRGNAKARLASLAQVIAAREGEDTWESLRVEQAEAQVAAAPGDEVALRAAVDGYRQALVRSSGNDHPLVAVKRSEADAAKSPAAALQALRAAYARACLVESVAGERLLQQALAIKLPDAGGTGNFLLSPLVRDWQVLGVFPNEAWQAYDKPPVVGDAKGRVDTSKDIAGQKWTRPGLDRYVNGVLDLARLFSNPSNCVAFTYREIDMPTAGDGELAIGADDGLVVWFNGKKVHEDREQRGVLPGSIIVPVRFEAGLNSLLCMVQQGSSEYGLHLKVNSATAQGADLANLLNLLERSAEARGNLSTAFAALVDVLAGAGKADEAIAVARLVCRALPEKPELQLAVGDRLIIGERDKPRVLAQAAPLVRWMSAMAERRSFTGKDAWLTTFRPRAAQVLVDSGDLAAAVTMLRSVQLTSFEADAQIRVLVDLGRLYRLAGYPRTAVEFYRKASERPIGDDQLRREVQEGLFRVRGAKGEGGAFAISLEAGTMVQTADRAAAAGDVDRAVRTYQRVIDQHATALVRLDGGKVVGLAEYAGDRLRALSADGLAAYRKLVDLRAADLVKQAGVDVDALAAVLQTYPASSVAPEVLSRLADLALDAGQGERAAQALARLDASGPAGAMLTAKRAYALELAGDVAGARAALAELTAKFAGADLTIRGKTMKTEAYAAERRQLIDAAKPTPTWLGVGGGPARRNWSPELPVPTACRSETVLPVHLAERIYADRFAPTPFQHLMLHPVSDGRTAFLHTLDEAFAIDLASGQVRWRSGTTFAELRRGERVDGFSGAPETMTALAGGRVFVRALRRSAAGSAYAIEARSADNGALLWSSETAIATASAISSPLESGGKVVAVFQDIEERFRNTVVAFAAADGRVLWRTPLADGIANLTLSSQQEISLSEHLSAPSAAGGDIFISTDMGSIVALDASAGAVRWAATYPRAVLDATGSRASIRLLANRAASRVVVGRDTIYVAPRDTLAVLAIARANGDIRWRHDLSACRALVGLSADGATLVTQDDGLEGVDATDGSRRWHWTPERAAPLWGVATLAGGTAYVAAGNGLARIDLATGRSQGLTAWSALDLAQPVGNLVPLGDVLLGVGRDRFVVLAAAPAKKQVQVVPWSSGIPLSASGLPMAEFAAPLVLRWRLDGGTDAGIHQFGDEVYLDLGDRLVRLDPKGEQVVWEQPIAPGAVRLIPSKEMLLLAYPRSVVALEPATGRPLWTHAVAYDDGGFFLDTEGDERKRERYFDEVSASTTAVAVRRREARQVELLAPSDGHELATIGFATPPRWTAMIGAELIAVTQVGEKLIIEGRAPTGGVTWTRELPLGDKNLRHFNAILAPDRSAFYLATDRLLAGFDLAQKTVLFSQPLQSNEYPQLTFENGQLSLLHRRGNEQWRVMLVDARSGKTLFEQDGQRSDRASAFSRPRFSGDFAVFSTDQRKDNRWVTTCRSLSTGKELWTADVGDRHRRRFLRQDIAGRLLIQVFGEWDDPRLYYQLIELETGKRAGSGELPGFPPPREQAGPEAAVVGGIYIYGTQQGVAAVGGLAPAPAGRRPLDAAITQLRAATTAQTRAGEGAGEFLATYAPDVAPALYTSQPPRIDGQFGDWNGEDSIILNRPSDLRLEPGASANGVHDLSAKARLMWDKRFVYLAVEVEDDRFDPPAPGSSPLDGDSVLLGIDPDGAAQANEDRQPLVLALSLVDGRTRLTQLSGRTVEIRNDDEETTVKNEDDRASARMVRRAGGFTCEVALPWTALRGHPYERPGNKTGMGLGLAVFDRDGSQSKAIEWGYGLVRGINSRRFAQITFIDLTPERIASYRKFIALMPAHEFAWRFVQRIAATHLGPTGRPGRIAELEAFITANPASLYVPAALSEIGRLHQDSGVEKPTERLVQFATTAKIPLRTIGDAVGPGPATQEQGRAFRQWVWLDPIAPPQEVMLHFRSTSEDFTRGVYWGQDRLQWGERGTIQRLAMGALPASGQWVALTIPVALLRMDGQEFDNIRFALYGGTVQWGRSEYVEDGKVTVLIDPDKGANFDKQTQWSEVGGRKAHSPGFQGGEFEYHANNGVFKVDLRRKDQAPETNNKEVMLRKVQAAKLIPDTEEAFQLMREAEGLCEGPEPQRQDAMVAFYRDFLAAMPANPQAAKILTHLRNHLENWTNGKEPARRQAAVARIEKLMDEVKLSREERRQFYTGFVAGINDWKVLGYFDPNRGAQNISEALPPERGAIDLDLRYVGIRDQELAWTDIQGNGNLINIAASLRDPRDKDHRRYPVAYLYTRLEVPSSAESVLYLGCKGQAAVWVNGKRLGGVLLGDRGFQRDSFALPCKLQKGINEILIKATDRDGGPQVSCRFGDVSGRPLEGLVPRLPPGLVRVKAGPPTQAVVIFSGPLDPASAETVANYAIDKNVTISAASLSKDQRNVALTVSGLAEGTDYTVTVNKVRSLSGTEIKANARNRFRLAAFSTGKGLTAEFFDGTELKTPLITRIDATVDFDWGDNDQPDPGVHAQNFSVRWSGQVVPTHSDTWTFTTITDDGARLWVDGKQIVDQWVNQAAVDHSGSMVLEAGKKYDIRFEYFQGGGAAAAKLLWSCSKVEREIIPASQLIPRAESGEKPPKK